MDWTRQNILITGGTGSFGKVFTQLMVREFRPHKVIVYSRDELKQHEMQVCGEFSHPAMRYFIGDVRDKERLLRAMREVDIVIHAAALKQVPACEYNPWEAVNTNIIGSKNVVDAALDAGVKKVVALSTDKAVSPVNLYGATKLAAEKLVVQSNSYSGNNGTRFSCVRYGNVLGSRGSVIPVFMKQRETGAITITDPRMTRFWISLDQAARFVVSTILTMTGGEVFIPKIPSMNIMDLADAIAPECEKAVVGIRPGEKLHETLISTDEAMRTLENDDKFILMPAYPWWKMGNYGHTEPVPEGFSYTSANNPWQLSVADLAAVVGALDALAA